ncbi:unnamed protein product, partial [Didymodactylos carnosus]
SLEIADLTFVQVNNNCSIIAVGWDKRINVFKDDREKIKQVSLCEDEWDDDIMDGHEDDILCIAKSQGDLFATGDYSGEIIVWNMSSKKVFAKMRSEKFPSFDNNEKKTNDRLISRMTFIDSRTNRRDAANLISSGPYGMIHFWCVYKNGMLMAKFKE